RALARQGQACLRQAAERVIPELIASETQGRSVQPAPKKPNGPPVPREARCVRLPAKAENVQAIAPVVEQRTLTRALNELLIEVKAAAGNPSDVKGATGLVAYARCPQTPGRHCADTLT